MDAIERQGQQMLKLVNQLLNMSKINASKDLIRWEKGNIIPYLEMVIDSISIYVKKKEQSITFTSNQPEITMNFVPEYFQNILQNLLSNAIKFSPSNSIIRVSVKLDKEQFILEVADQGIGISKEHQKKLFDLFYQVSKSDSNNGTGIGLSYTKQLVEAMKGNIEVESEVNAGSVFKVTIPIQNSEPEKITVVDKSNTDSPDLFKKALQHIIMPKEISEDNSNTKILLIEDNRDVVLYLRSMLENRYEVVVEEDVVKGLDVAHNMIPDIIISDIVMPNKDGLSLCKDIRDSALLS
jgi:two-component system sensor histidine kinase ChiS